MNPIQSVTISHFTPYVVLLPLQARQMLGCVSLPYRDKGGPFRDTLALA